MKIDNPLQWQEKIDNAPASINLRRSGRFWETVEEKLGTLVYRNGAPECSEIIIALGDNIALELSTEADNPFIEYRFIYCPVGKEKVYRLNTNDGHQWTLFKDEAVIGRGLAYLEGVAKVDNLIQPGDTYSESRDDKVYVRIDYEEFMVRLAELTMSQ